MKKLLTLTLITTSCYGTTVTLTLNNVQASPSSNTFVCFELFNYGNNVPQVVGSFSLVPPFVDLYPNSSGIISGNIQGNDTITPANTYYHMTFYNKVVKYYSCDVSITGSSVNLNNSSCMNVTPSPAPNYSGPVPVTLGSASCAPPDAIQSISGGNTTCIPVTSLADTTFITGNGKQTHHVLSVANNTTINIGGLGADPASLNDIFTQSDVGDIIRVIVKNASSLVDYETTIVTVNSTTQAVIALAPTITSTTGEAFWFPPSEDDTTAFQTALNSGVGTIIINKGGVVISNALTNVRNTTRILGEGSLRSTILLRSSDVSDSFDFTDVIGLNLIGFSVVGPGENSISGGTINFNLSDFDNWERLYVRD